MNNYIIVITLCNSKKIADEIVNTLLNKRYIAGAQITKLHSKYRWNNNIEECDEYKIEFRTKALLYKNIEDEIKQIHNYDVAEISSYEIKNASKEFKEWIDSNVI